MTAGKLGEEKGLVELGLSEVLQGIYELEKQVLCWGAILK
jgi:hypothetical protein